MMHMSLQAAPHRGWRRLPLPALPEPVLALAVGRERLWAGGLGGVACRRLEGAPDEWEAGPVLPPAPVVALCSCGDLLLAGGSGGIAYLPAGSSDWQPAALENGVELVTVLAPSPDFAEDGTLLAGTLLNGVLRSDDGGRSWHNASFGMECLEVTALLWLSRSLVLAATDDGIYRSRDGGRGWRQVLERTDDVVIGLTSLPDGSLLAVLEGGGVLRASGTGEDWSPVTQLSAGLCSLCLMTTSRGTLLLGTGKSGLLRSGDGGQSWQAVHAGSVHVCLEHAGRLYAGTDEGLLLSEDDGVSWQMLPRPPLQDLHRLFAQNNHLLLAGTHSGILRLTLTDASAETSGSWEPLSWLPQPLQGCALLDDETLLVAGSEGLLRVSLADERRTRLLEQLPEQPMVITWAVRGGARHLWVASGDGQHLWHSADDGASWRRSSPPFGVTTLVALQAMPTRLLAATYDLRQYRLCLWYSYDEGTSWVRALEAETNWPLVATCAQPPAVSVGNLLLLAEPDGDWRRIPLGQGGGIRRLAVGEQAGGQTLFVLAGDGIFATTDGGASWQTLHDELPVDHILDIACSSAGLFALLSGGAVYWRSC